MVTLIPAYGRDYKSVKEVYAALAKNEEFEVVGVVDGGGYVTQKELLEVGETRVFVRYSKQSKKAIFGLPAPGTPVEAE